MQKDEDGYYIQLDASDDVQRNAFLARGENLLNRFNAAIEADQGLTLSLGDLVDLHTVLRSSASTIIELVQQVQLFQFLALSSQAEDESDGPAGLGFNGKF